MILTESDNNLMSKSTTPKSYISNKTNINNNRQYFFNKENNFDKDEDNI